MKEGKLKEYAKLIRIRTFGLSLIAVIGALSVKGDVLEISHFILLFSMGIIITIYGFVYNDYKDFKSDKLSKELNGRPLVKGTISYKTALTVVTLCLILIFTIPLIFFRNILSISVLIVAIILGALYNVFSKKLVGSDIFLAGELALFCLFGALAVSDNVKGLQEIGWLTWIVVAIMFIHVFFANAIGGGLKDVDNDRKAGAKKLTVYLGVEISGKMLIPNSFKIIALLLKIIMVVLVFTPFIFLNLKFWFWQIIILILFAIGMLWSTMKILNMVSFDRVKVVYYNGKDVLISFDIILLMLMGFIGLIWTFFLILLPFLWFVLFNYLLFGDLLPKPKKF